MYSGVCYITPSKSGWTKVSAGFLLFIFCHAESFEMQSFWEKVMSRQSKISESISKGKF